MKNSDRPENPIDPEEWRTKEAATNLPSPPALSHEPGSVAYQFGVAPQISHDPSSFPTTEPIPSASPAAPTNTGEAKPGAAAAAAEQGVGAEIAPAVKPGFDLPPPAQPLKPEFAINSILQFLREYRDGAKAVCFSPTQFFDNMPTAGGWNAPAAFLATSAGGYFLMLCLFTGGNSMGAFLETIFSVLLIAVLGRGAQHILQQFGGKGTLEGTFRVLAYSSPPLILMGCPWIQAIALIYMTVLWYLGLKKVHEIKGNLKS